MKNNFTELYFKYSGYIFRIFPDLLSFMLPKTIVVEASNICMLKCPACATVHASTREKGVMSFDTFKKLIDEIDWDLKRINFSFAGEPLVNPEIFKMIQYANALDIETIIETNGVLLEKCIDELLKSGLSRINIAFDGINQETVSKYRRGIEFDNVLNAIKRLTSQRRQKGLEKPKIHLQYILMKHNVNHTDEAINIARELGADSIEFKSMILSGGFDLAKNIKEQLALEYLPDSASLRRYEHNQGKWKLAGRLSRFCTHVLSDTVIMWNGDVTVCTMDVNGRLIQGNILKNPLKAIWKSKKYCEIRQKILKNQLDVCSNCEYLVDDFKCVDLKKED